MAVSWYDYPQYYSLAYRSDTRQEVDFIEAACRLYCPSTARRLLEPACGSGRVLTELAARGYRMAGFDTSEAGIRYLDRRLARRGLHANVFLADMTDFKVPKPYDGVFCTVSSFLHLLTEEAARRHLECVTHSLRPGGIYILGLELMPVRAPRDITRRWTESHGRTQVTFTQRVVSTDRRHRVETIRMSLLVRRAKSELRLRDEYGLRIYTPRQFRQLLSSVPALDLCGVYDSNYDIDRPVELNDRTVDAVLILRKAA